ncbi:single-stranded DNA-binding protein [Brachybacterium endophyticum]|nr:single-stranded DNA-binding protein [Brachybacterium endophyticum]
MSLKDVYVTIRGNACKDADLTGNSLEETVGVRVAVTRRYFDRSEQQYKDVRTTDYYNVYGTKTLGKNMRASIRKGDPVIVTGRLNYSEWAKEDGTEGHSMVIRADAIGHDLTFGTTSMRRSGRAEETPSIEFASGEANPGVSIVRPAVTGADGAGEDELAGADAAVTADASGELAGQGSGNTPF